MVSPHNFRDANLGFASSSAGAAVDSVGPGHIELGADGWDLILAFDAEGRLASEVQVVFEFVFEERRRRVRCRPGEPATGTLSINSSTGSNELSGNFDIELDHCEDANTGESIGWPPKPLVLHGSFDRLVLGTPLDRR